MKFSTSDIFDSYADEISVCDIQFMNFGRRTHLAGPCRSIKVFEDHRIVKNILSTPGAGCVLVVDGGGSRRIALMGDVMAGLAMRNGWAGIVIHGAIRDSQAIGEIDLCVKALGTTARRSQVEVCGSVDRPVAFGGVRFRPGDWVYADADAVIVSSRQLTDIATNTVD